MKEKILEVLTNRPKGLRLRELGGVLGVWHPSLVKDIDELETAGKIVGVPCCDMANMEFYYIWKINA